MRQLLFIFLHLRFRGWLFEINKVVCNIFNQLFNEMLTNTLLFFIIYLVGIYLNSRPHLANDDLNKPL